MHRTTIGRVRLIGLLEGVSYVLLVFIAMPLKYGAGMPQMVSVVGMAHGILFMLYLLVIGLAMRKHRWPMSFGGLLVLGSLIPIGPFLLDGRLKRKQTDLASDHGSKPTPGSTPASPNTSEPTVEVEAAP